MDRFQKRNLNTYWELTTELLNFIRTNSVVKDVSAIDDMLLFVQNVCLTNETKMKEGVQVWVDSMLEPLESVNTANLRAYFQSIEQMRAVSVISLTSIAVILSRLEFLKNITNKS